MKWDEEVLEALRNASRPMRSGEIAAAIMGYENGPSILTISQHVPSMWRRHLLVKVIAKPYTLYKPLEQK